MQNTMKEFPAAEERETCMSGIEDILRDVRNGKPVIIVDDENRENEGDLVIAAQMATPENINFMAKYGRGLICLPMEQTMIDRLGLELMGRGNNTHHRTAFTVSIEAKEGVTTGISASDRAKTIQTAINSQSGPGDIATPGHVFPLRAREGGVLVRAGHTEAAVDLSRMAGFSGAGVICEIMNEDGSMARLRDLVAFANSHDLKIGSIADLIAWRRRNEKLVEKISEKDFESPYGDIFRFCIYANTINYAEHIALVRGNPDHFETKSVSVRMHALNIIDDVLMNKGNGILQRALNYIGKQEEGVIVIIREPDPTRLSRILNKDKMENSGTLRDYGVGAQILKDLGIRKMKLLTNSPKTVIGLDGYGLEITDYVSV